MNTETAPEADTTEGAAPGLNAGLCGLTLLGWEYRTYYGEDTVTPGWAEWEPVKARNTRMMTDEDAMKEIEGYIANGYKYEIRDLYVKPHNA